MMNLNEHGGNVHKVAELYGKQVEEIIDFSSNINPLGISSILKKMLIESIEHLEYYPDPEYRKLRNQIAEYAGVCAKNIIPCNGALEGIYVLLKTLKPSNIIIPAPCFSEYEKAARNAGIVVNFLKLDEQDGFKLNTKLLIREMQNGAKCVLLCNPNNPTSTIISVEEIEEILKVAIKNEITVIVDEAFIELTDKGAKNSVACMVNKYQNLYIIRAFTKIFAVPGIRLGYVVGNSSIIESMMLNVPCWSVNSFAVAAGGFLSNTCEYLSQTKSWLMSEKPRFYNRLMKISKIKVFKPNTNFILIKLLTRDLRADTLKNNMVKKGILIRDASNFKFLNEKFIRIAIKDSYNNDILIEALKKEIT